MNSNDKESVCEDKRKDGMMIAVIYCRIISDSSDKREISYKEDKMLD